MWHYKLLEANQGIALSWTASVRGPLDKIKNRMNAILQLLVQTYGMHRSWGFVASQSCPFLNPNSRLGCNLALKGITPLFIILLFTVTAVYMAFYLAVELCQF